MLRSSFTAIVIVSFTALHSFANVQDPADQKIEPSLQIKGTNKNAVLRTLSPRNGLITNQASLRNLLVTWQPLGKVPTVDFEKNVVLVRTLDGAYNVFPKSMVLDKQGNLNCEFLTTATDGKPSWFSYYIAAVPKAGIKKIDGKQVSINSQSKTVESKDIAASNVPLKIPGKSGTQKAPPSNAAANQWNDSPPNGLVRESIQVDIIGKIQTGLVAIGGETTGTVIGSNGIVWELDFQNNQEMIVTATKIGSKLAHVKGALVRVQGIEVPDRLVVKVKSINGAKRIVRPLAEKETPRIHFMPKTEPVKEPVVTAKVDPPTPDRASHFESITLKASGGVLGRGQTHTLAPDGKISLERGDRTQTSWMLPTEKLQKIDLIVANTNWEKLPRVSRSKDSARDSLQYQVLIETPRHTYRFFSDGESIGNQAQLTELLSLMVVREQTNSNPQR